MNYLNFLSPGQKIKGIRNKLNINQVELEQIGVSRNFISMVENDKRSLSGDTLEKLIEFFNAKSLLEGIELNLNKEDLLLSEEDEAKNYCLKQLETNLTVDEISDVIYISEKYKLIDVLSKAYTQKGNHLYNTNKYTSAFIFYNKALEIYISTQNDLLKPFIYNKLGKCKTMELSYKEALSYFFKCLFYSKEISDITSTQNCLYNLALVYKKVGDYDNSLIYINEYISVCNTTNNFNDYIEGIILKSNCYLAKKEYEVALKIYNELTDKYNNKLGNLLGYIYNNYGLIYLNLNDYKQSLEYFDNAIKFKELNDIQSLSHTFIDKSKVYITQGLKNEAILLIEKGIDLAKKYSDKEYVLSGYLLLEDLYVSLSNTEKLKGIYLDLINYLNCTNIDTVTDIYIKLSILYLDNKEYDKCKECLTKIQSIKK